MARIGPAPRELLAAADDLLSQPFEVITGAWPRTVAILCRQALEGAMFDFWRAKAPGVEAASTRAQLLTLRAYVSHDLAARTELTWTALSRACHHHAYDLSPTASELAGWLEVVDEFERAVRGRVTAAGRSRGGEALGAG